MQASYRSRPSLTASIALALCLAPPLAALAQNPGDPAVWQSAPRQAIAFEPGLGFVEGELVNFVPRELQPRESVEELVDDSPFAGFLPDVEAARADEATPLQDTAEATNSAAIEARSPTTAAEILQDSPAIQSVNIQRRSTIAFDPRITLGPCITLDPRITLCIARLALDTHLARIALDIRRSESHAHRA